MAKKRCKGNNTSDHLTGRCRNLILSGDYCNTHLPDRPRCKGFRLTGAPCNGYTFGQYAYCYRHLSQEHEAHEVQQQKAS